MSAHNKLKTNTNYEKNFEYGLDHSNLVPHHFFL